MLKTAESGGSGRSGRSGGEHARRTIASGTDLASRPRRARRGWCVGPSAAESCAALSKVSLPQVSDRVGDVRRGGRAAAAARTRRRAGWRGQSVRRSAGGLSCGRHAPSPSADSEIKMELWLPATWNGKFKGTGNGGLGGGAGVGASTHSRPASAADTRRRGTTPVTKATRATRWSIPSASRTSGTSPRTR